METASPTQSGRGIGAKWDPQSQAKPVQTSYVPPTSSLSTEQKKALRDKLSGNTPSPMSSPASPLSPPLSSNTPKKYTGKKWDTVDTSQPSENHASQASTGNNESKSIIGSSDFEKQLQDRAKRLNKTNSSHSSNQSSNSQSSSSSGCIAFLIVTIAVAAFAFYYKNTWQK